MEISEGFSKDEGWGYPLNARKSHYFVDRMSLCGRWMYFGVLSIAVRPNPCRTCMKKLEKKREKKKLSR